MPVCPMCETEVPTFHKKSHVLPEWMYADCKDALNRGIFISLNNERAKFSQSGIYGSYWCPDCEVESNWPDTYASRVLTQKGRRESREAKEVTLRPVQLKVRGEDISHVQWAGLDYKSLSQFVQVCVLRAHLHRKSRGDSPLLTDAEFEGLRFTYRTKFIDDKTFPIIAYFEPDNAVYRSMVMLPHNASLGGGRCVEFKGPGFVFILQLERVEDNDNVFAFMRLKESGEFVTLFRRYEEGGTFKHSAPDLMRILLKHSPSKFQPKVPKG